MRVLGTLCWGSTSSNKCAQWREDRENFVNKDSTQGSGINLCRALCWNSMLVGGSL